MVFGLYPGSTGEPLKSFKSGSDVMRFALGKKTPPWGFVWRAGAWRGGECKKGYRLRPKGSICENL